MNQTQDRGQEVAIAIQNEVGKVVFGPELQNLVKLLVMAVYANGHVIVRAPVGLGKTLACAAMARALGGVFNVRQFTPDMLPSELTGFKVYNQKTGKFEFEHGPFFGSNVFLADEINRATPKTQSAMLGAMEERRLTVAKEVFRLEPVFMVLATRNPMEHEGTYQLPEAQMDRFMFQPVIRDISEETGMEVLSDQDFWRPAEDRLHRIQPVTTPAEILAIREAIFTQVHVEERLKRYIWRLRTATWKHEMVAYGVSPRGAIDLKKAAMVAAYLAGPREIELSPGEIIRGYCVTPEDVEGCAVDVLAHRVFMKPEARFDPHRATSPAAVIREVLDAVKPE